jgi:hypothetical protein
LNPIEPAFSKLKTLLGKENARTVQETWQGVGRLVDQLTPTSAPITSNTPDMRQRKAIRL